MKTLSNLPCTYTEILASYKMETKGEEDMIHLQVTCDDGCLTSERLFLLLFQ